ncbi:hypothetical protein QAO71_17845 (plasmid) [Halopseudomonas sp. SMJS2]|uniref:hypothetical protein n=1 Tax=Halopseudomonas sp. SMJS2 TaxID=3041098 RepID=UPI0024528608|nr:hypothetical protein [Halopseudomonas sp. SMJS2]WGK63405.1 hypothetical protein QAO71_17845 [Halopseudomonas sp. SMJS2]
MGWSYARVDFLPAVGAYCIFCRRELKAKKGIVVRQSDGREAFSGPGCAKSKMGDPKERLLDVASMALLVVEGRRGEAARSGPSSTASPGEQPEPRLDPGNETSEAPSPSAIHLPAVEYLRLRYEVMGEFNGNVTAVMRQAYWHLNKTGVLSPDAEGLLLGIMRKSAIDNSVFSDRNIRRCIGLEYWLKLALQNTKPDRRDYLNSMLDTLHYEWSLSQGQIEAINKWGKGLRKTMTSFPTLNNRSFAGVRRPDFMIRSRETRS